MESERGEDLYAPNDIMCCDYEAYQDNTFSCNLFAGSQTEQQDLGVYANEYFSSNVYVHVNSWKE